MAVPVFNIPRTKLRRRRLVHQNIRFALAQLHKEVELGLHLGAGETKIDGLINCDLYSSSAEREVDATDLTAFADNSIDLIEHHHLVEHLSFEELDRALGEWIRVLRPDGYLIMTCPDIFRVCLQYVLQRAKSYVSKCDEEIEYTIKMLVGSQEHEGMFHRNHFDPSRMREILGKRGMRVVFSYPFPVRPTPSMLIVAQK